MPLASGPAVNWAGNVTFGAVRVCEPASVDELRGIVARSRRVRALGSGHSFSRVADTRGDLVRLDRLPRVVTVSPERRTVTVSAATRYAELADHLHAAGFALANLASLPHISVAGACATGTHGSGDAQRCLAASVCGLEVVGAAGDLTQWGRETDSDTWAGKVVALGALGVVTRLTLDIEPAFDVAQQVYESVHLDEVISGPDEVFAAAYSVSVFTDWRSGQASVWLKHRADGPKAGWRGEHPASRPVHPVPGMPPEFATEQLGVTGPWHHRLPHFRPDLPPSASDELQSEYYLPSESAPAALAAIRAIGDLIAPVLHISELRTVRSDDLWLSPAYGRDSMTIHFTWVRDETAVLPVLAAVEDLLMPLGARPHWGKLTLVPLPQLMSAYARGAEFAALARGVDPAGKFRNKFVDSLLGTGCR